MLLSTNFCECLFTLAVLKLFIDTKGEFSVKITTVIVEYGTVSAIPMNFLLFNLLMLSVITLLSEMNFIKVKLLHFIRKYNLLFSLI
jgi:hypothetical protein